MNSITRGYLEAALFAENANDGKPLNYSYCAMDFAESEVEKARKVCEAFTNACWERGLNVAENWNGFGVASADAGHDLWLTSQGHGAGFWDGNWGEHGDQLTAIAKEVGAHVQGVYVGDDGELYFG